MMTYLFWVGQGVIHDLNGNRVTKLEASKDIFAEKKVVNTTGAKKQLTLWFVLYDANNTMIDFASAIAELKPGETRTLGAGFTLPTDVTNFKVKVLIWDSLNNIVGQSPLTEELVVQ